MYIGVSIALCALCSRQKQIVSFVLNLSQVPGHVHMRMLSLATHILSNWPTQGNNSET